MESCSFVFKQSKLSGVPPGFTFLVKKMKNHDGITTNKWTWGLFVNSKKVSRLKLGVMGRPGGSGG